MMLFFHCKLLSHFEKLKLLLTRHYIETVYFLIVLYYDYGLTFLPLSHLIQTAATYNDDRQRGEVTPFIGLHAKVASEH